MKTNFFLGILTVGILSSSFLELVRTRPKIFLLLALLLQQQTTKQAIDLTTYPPHYFHARVLVVERGSSRSQWQRNNARGDARPSIDQAVG